MISEEILDKLKQMDCIVVPIILDGAARSVNLLRKYLIEIIDTKVPLALNTHKKSFEINGHNYFTLLFLVRIITCARIHLIEINKYFTLPELKDDEGKKKIIASVCDVKFIK